MNTDDIMRMAQKAGAFVLGDFIEAGKMDIEQFANLVAAAEREACALLCDHYAHNEFDVASSLADAIQARGQK